MRMELPLGDGIIPPRIERVAAYHTPGSHQTAFDNPEFVDRLVTIMRAGGVKAAGIGRHGSREGHLVKTNQRQEEYPGQIHEGNGQISQPRLRGVIMLVMRIGISLHDAHGPDLPGPAGKQAPGRLHGMWLKRSTCEP